MFFCILLREHSKSSQKLLSTLAFFRSMGGGPRTFPGGLNKWQWKRLHEKKAKEKEKRLLDQEKQLYQARIRSQIRAKLAGRSDTDPPSDSNYSPMTANEQIKALADRFMKAGAEDLWNEADGPTKSPTPRSPTAPSNRSIRAPIDLRKLISESDRTPNSTNSNGSLKPRHYSVYTRRRTRSRFNFGRNESSMSEDDSDSDTGLVTHGTLTTAKLPRFGSRNEASDEDFSEEEVEEMKGKERKETLLFNVPISLSTSTSDIFEAWCKKHGKTYSSDQEKLFRFKIFQENYEFVTRHNSQSNSPYKVSLNAFSDLTDEEFKSSHLGFRCNPSENKSTDVEDYDRTKGAVTPVKNQGECLRTRLMSSAALGKYDMQKTRRVPLKFLEQEENLSEHIEAIRKEVSKRNALENDADKSEEISILSEKRFDECDVSPLTIKALTQAGYVKMTRVQDASLSLCLEGKDALVKAKTGTGKSAAFLLPAIETVLKASTSKKNQRVPPIYVLILCPTRELASQIAAEANVMLRYHDGIGVQTLIGGTRFKVDQKRLESDPCQIIVATPGRLLDHIENKSGFSVRLMGLKMLVLDEADHLLDLGFRKDMEKIVDCLPRQRQSLLFSATIPKEVRRISQLVLKREHAYIDTVGLGCLETHAKVKQFSLVAPHELHFQLVHHLLSEHISQAPDYKVIVFCKTAMLTSLLFLLLREMKLNVREIHSRKPQLYRTRISDEFRESKRLILITSDVSARGMNYPDVTLVIQMGIPSDREQYIHRLGRTGREGKGGEGILLLAPWEEYFLDEIKDLPVEKFPLPHLDQDVKIKMDNSMAKIDGSIKEAAYHAWLGYYNSLREIGRDKTTLVELANQFCQSIGLEKPPALFRKTALKMGLKDIPGIRIRK